MAPIDLLSFQLYSARNFPPLEAQLAELAGLGYARVEPYGGLYAAPDEFAAALRRHRLSAPSGHFDLALLEDNPARAAAIAHRLEMRLVVAPYLAPPDRPKDAAGWRAFGARLAPIAGKLRAEGLSFAWHNHDFEMRPLPDGSYPIDIVLSASDRILWQADVGWIARAGEDPLHWLARHSGRVGALHVKDLAPRGENLDEEGWADIGAGVLDIGAIVKAGIAAGAAVLVAEHDAPNDYRRFARRSIETARSWR
ncbi:MAG TPA: sugar phosphate isomerase/epimerase [Roseiarcus sp.]|nr:sugar phosphate isomerase/epimerase [Roseiarcus sp.]